MAKHLEESFECATIGYKLEGVLPEEGSVNRGIFEVEGNYVRNLEEVFDITRGNFEKMDLRRDSLCSMNIFALYPETVEMLNDILEKFKVKNRGERSIECLLPNDISNLIRQKKIKMRIYPSEDKWYGVTNPEDEEIVKEQLKSI